MTTDERLQSISRDAVTLKSAIEVLLRLRQSADEDGEGVGIRAERDVALLFRAIEEQLRSLKLVRDDT